MSNAPQKPQAVSHMLWFFVLPAVGFMVWASIKVVQVVSQKEEKVAVFQRLENIEKAKSPGDRWQAAYALAQDLQKMKHSGTLDQELNDEEKMEFFDNLERLIKTHASDDRFKKYLYLTVGQMGDPLALNLLEQGLKDSNDEIRFFSAWGTVDILLKNPEHWNASRENLVRSWATDKDPALRKVAASTLVQMNEFNKYEDTFKLLLSDSEPEVRWNTAVALASKKSPLGVEKLREMFVLENLRQLEFKSTKDLSLFVGSAFDAAKKLGDEKTLTLVDKLRSEVSPNTPEGKAILSALK